MGYEYKNITSDQLWNNIFPEKDISNKGILQSIVNPMKIILFGNGLTVRHDPNFKNDQILSNFYHTLEKQDLSKHREANNAKIMILNILPMGIESVENILFHIRITKDTLERIGIILPENWKLCKLHKVISDSYKLFIQDALIANKNHHIKGMGKWLQRFNGIFSLNYDTFSNTSLMKECNNSCCDFFTDLKGDTEKLFFENEKYKHFILDSKKSYFFNLHGSLFHQIHKGITFKHSIIYEDSNKNYKNVNEVEPCIIGGDGKYKKKCIEKSEYLTFCFDQFTKVLQNDKKKDVLIFGASLSDKDSHLVEVIKNINNASIYFSHREKDHLKIATEKRNLYHHINDHQKSKAFFVYTPDDSLPFESIDKINN
jgi:Domain of unknown function (DUF4917)